MKVGIDGILLGAWARVADCVSILDIGTGTGLLTLMLAQRTATGSLATRTRLDAVELDGGAYAEALRNVERSRWADRIEVAHDAIQTFPGRGPYDHVICNPPFFSEGPVSPHQQRAVARHDRDLSWDVVCHESVTRLSEAGRLSVIMPAQRFMELTRVAQHHGLHGRRLTWVRPQPARTPHRVLLEFGRSESDMEIDALAIERSRHCYTSEFRELTREFYLAF